MILADVTKNLILNLIVKKGKCNHKPVKTMEFYTVKEKGGTYRQLARPILICEKCNAIIR